MRVSQDSKDVEEKLGGLIRLLKMLEDVVPVASPDGDPEDKKIHEQFAGFVSCLAVFFTSPTIFARALEDIGNDAVALHGKSGEAKFFDYRRDSAKLAKLVGRLQDVILIYQVGAFESH